MSSVWFVIFIAIIAIGSTAFWGWMWAQRRNLAYKEKFRLKFFALANELVENDALTVGDIATIQAFAQFFGTPLLTKYLILALIRRSRFVTAPKSTMSHLPKDIREKWREMFVYGLLMATTAGPITGCILRYQIAFALSPDEESTTVRVAQAAINDANRGRHGGGGLPQAA